MQQINVDKAKMAATPNLKIDYEGSVKNVLSNASDHEHLWFQFTDDYSVFDWGKMPDKVANKGTSLALIGAYMFEKLTQNTFWTDLPQSSHLKKFNSDFIAERWRNKVFSAENGLARQGLASHFVALVGANQEPIELNAELCKGSSNLAPLMKVLRAEVSRPKQRTLSNHNLYFYDPNRLASSDRRLIPLEVVFRFGMGTGSSLTKRLNEDPNYSQSLGLDKVPVVDQWFDRPVIEFFTKLEPKDRLLAWQEAALLSGLTAELFEQLVETALDIALALHHIFAEKKLELWDGKLEFVLEPGQKTGNISKPARILLADSIGPDELRLIYRGQQLSKELIRQYYRETPWAKAVPTAQKKAQSELGRDWKEICLNDLNQAPPRLPAPVKTQVDRLYGVLTNHLFGKAVFANQPNLDEFVGALDTSLLAANKRNS